MAAQPLVVVGAEFALRLGDPGLRRDDVELEGRAMSPAVFNSRARASAFSGLRDASLSEIDFFRLMAR